MRDDEIGFLRAAVEAAPHDTFHRCNLACSLATRGAIDESLLQLAAASATATSPIAAGCVAAALRDVADELARQWSLPVAPFSPPPDEPPNHAGPSAVAATA